MRSRRMKIASTAAMVSVIIPFEFVHDFPLHRVRANEARVVYAQSLHGTGVDVMI